MNVNKVELEGAKVLIHLPEDETGATSIHVDVEHPALADIMAGEGTYAQGKGNGAFIGLKKPMARRARAVVDRLRGNGQTKLTEEET